MFILGKGYPDLCTFKQSFRKIRQPPQQSPKKQTHEGFFNSFQTNLNKSAPTNKYVP